MKLKTEVRFEERAGKEAYLVNSDKELLINMRDGYTQRSLSFITYGS